MKYHILKIFRVVLALLLFIPITIAFCDFTGTSPSWFHILPDIQFVPALLSGSIIIVVVLLLLSLLLGRIYCSVICPLGVLQDIIARLHKRKKKGKARKRRYRFTKPYNLIRYSLLLICVIFLFLAATTPILLLDPYSNYGRIAVNIFRPILMEANNALAWVALKFGNYSLHHVSVYTLSFSSLLIAFIALLTVGIMSFLRGRLFCNTICPVGALFSLLSRFSLFGIKIDGDKCSQCRKCERNCKSECIDSKRFIVDNSRCVDCFNCLNQCKEGAISYTFRYGKANRKSKEPAESIEPIQPIQSIEVENKSRRQFLLTSAAIGATVPLLSSCVRQTVNNLGEVDLSKLKPITPPGSRSLAHFKEKCTACHLCVTHCPQQILKPAGFGFGLDYAFKPHMVFREGGFCNYSCVVCSEVCPNGAIQRVTEEEKKRIQIGVAKLNIDLCIVENNSTSCGACSEHCPTQALKMEPHEGGLTLPRLYRGLCIGCGGCESICPTSPVKAITVVANKVHRKARPVPQEEQEEVDLDELDFGF